MNVRFAGLVVVVGLLLVVTGLVHYVLARERQREEQAALDRRWNEVQRQAAQQSPRTLPGEAKPAQSRCGECPGSSGFAGRGPP
jgi:hypothetical protein